MPCSVQALELVQQLPQRNHLLGCIPWDSARREDLQGLAVLLPEMIAGDDSIPADSFWQEVVEQVLLRTLYPCKPQYTWLWQCPSFLQWQIDAALITEQHKGAARVVCPECVMVEGMTAQMGIEYDETGGRSMFMLLESGTCAFIL